MKTMIRICITLLLSAASFSAAGQQGVKVIDHGLDGDRRYYTAYCPDGQPKPLAQLQESGQVCTYLPPDGREVCRDRSPDEAARTACGVR